MQWHKLSDAQPKDGERVLVIPADGISDFCAMEYRGEIWHDDDSISEIVTCGADRWARVQLPGDEPSDGGGK